MKKILIIDDEEHIQELLKFNLEVSGYSVLCTKTGLEGYNMLKEEKPDLILLDWMLPEISGIEFLKKIRLDEELSYIPVIMLTAKNMEDDKIEGLECGADDFITKPFSVKELKARINTVLRRFNITRGDDEKNIVKVNNITLNTSKREVLKDDKKIDMTLKEFELLKLLMQNPERVITREEILDKVWGYEFYGETRTVDVHIRYLRKKLYTENEENPIETIRGVGYRFNK